jgi:2-oxoisovalerate dehydrogenase E1 component beta subunit
VVPIGKAAVRREGGDLGIVTYGAMVYTALDAAEILAKEGVQTEVLDMRSLQPLDEDALLETAMKTNKVIVLHEACLTGGAGCELAARIAEKAFDFLDGPVIRVAAKDTPVPYSPPLEQAFLPQVEDVLEAAKKLLAY